MRKHAFQLFSAGLLILCLSLSFFGPAQAQETEAQPVVRAVLFHSPTCPHCEMVIQDFMPPLLKQYGDQLKIVAINTIYPEGQELYQAAIDYYEIPQDRLGVPLLIVGEVHLVGSGEIPGQFPGIVASLLEEGGSDWPAVPGLAEVIAGVQFTSEFSAPPADAEPESPLSGMWTRFQFDPLANTIAVIVLVGMIASLVWVGVRFRGPLAEKNLAPKWLIPAVSLFGVAVAFYLTYVETSGVEAVCGPVGDCNTVQLSPYATLFGVLPVGLLGLIGYALILAAWAVYSFGPKSLRWLSAIGLWGMALFGTLFSIYLTFLEPFVIGATCMWCISSAIAQTVILMAATDPAKHAWQEDDFGVDFEEDAEPAEA